MHSDPLTNDELKERICKLEADIERLSRHDHLTGLLTRNAFINEIENLLQQAHGDTKVGAIIEISLRGLPSISGSLGRHVSDYVISALAARLNSLVLPHALKCRLDHRNYAIFMPHLSDALETLSEAKRIMEVMGQTVDWVDRKLAISLGAGVAMVKDNDGDASNLINNVGLALGSAIERGGAGYAFFNPALALKAKRRNDIQLALQSGMDNHALHLNYQPFYDCKTGALSGFEALMRLNNPDLGVISPVEFIPAAEESGLINRIGALALAEACQMASTLPSELTVAVNISPEQFYSGSLVTDVHNALEACSFPAYRLELEITESTLLKDSDIVMAQLSTLREMGCGIVLDDFGTGYSSLSYLWKFPFSKIKIDRSFVKAIDSNPMARGMIESIIDLSSKLGLKVTAEGIETPEHVRHLKSLGAQFLQGFLLAKPCKLEDVAPIVLRNFSDGLMPARTQTELQLKSA